jgi:hypothetical protein
MEAVLKVNVGGHCEERKRRSNLNKPANFFALTAIIACDNQIESQIF